MYQTNIQNQLFSAALPLKPLTAWAGSACSVTVAVPPAPALAGLGVSSVGVTLTLPDGHTVAASAVQVPGTPLWVATFAPDEFATAGHVAQGLMITVAGTDEHDVVRTWIVAKGDVDVMDGDAAPVSGGSYYAVKLRDAAPENPVEGDAYVTDGALSIYHDGEWVTIGGGGVVVDEDISASSPNPVRNSAIAAALEQKANASDLPYALVTLTTPTEWVFSGSGVQSGHAYSIVETNMVVYWNYVLMDNGTQVSSADIGERETTIDFSASGDPQVDITATLSGYALLDRAGNRVEVSGDTTLTLPAAVPGYLRDFLVRLTVSASSAITFSAQTGETITWDAMGDPSATFAAGTYLYRITEVAQGVFHAEDMLALVGLEAALAAINGGVAS